VATRNAGTSRHFLDGEPSNIRRWIIERLPTTTPDLRGKSVGKPMHLRIKLGLPNNRPDLIRI